jgi:hypothetical protein
MAGILDYKKFLNLFETTEDIKHVFPRDQHTYTFDFDGLGSDGWSAKLTWMTLVVDQVTFDSNKTPNFSGGTVIGYFLGGTANQPSGATMSFPKDMYSGPILPGAERNIPITVINILWTKGSLTKNKQLLLIQNWEPGVTPGDPTLSDDFIIILDPIPTELILTLESGPVIFGEEFQLSATTTMPDELAKTANARFFIRNIGTSTTFIGSATFINQIATVSVPTEYGINDPRNINSGTYTVFATSPSRRQYQSATSNTASQVILEGIPLVVDLSLVPSTVNSFNTNVNIIANATTATGYTWPNVGIFNTVTFTVIGTSTFPQQPTQVINTTTFDSGFAQTSLTVTNNFIDTTLNKYSSYTVLSTTGTTSTYTATVQISRPYPIRATWDYYRPGRYSSGSTSTTLSVTTVSNFTYDYNPITVQAIEQFGFADTLVVTSSTNQTYNKTSPLIKLKASLASSDSTEFDGASASVTFKAIYKPWYETDNILIPTYDLNANPIRLISAPTATTFRFDELPEFLNPGDSFLLGSTSFTVTSISTTTNSVTTRYWPGTINPSIYVNTVVTFVNNVNPVITPTVPTKSEWQLEGVFNQLGTPLENWKPTPDAVNWNSPDARQFALYRFNKLPNNLKVGDTFTYLSNGTNYFRPPWDPNYERAWNTNRIGQVRKIYAIDYSTRSVISVAFGRIADSGTDSGTNSAEDWLDWLEWTDERTVYTYLGMAGAYVQFSSVANTSTYFESLTLGTQTNFTGLSNSINWELSSLSLQNTGTYYISAEIDYSNNWPIYYRPTNSIQDWKLIVSDPLIPDIPATLVVTTSSITLTAFNYSGYTFFEPVIFREGSRYLGQGTWTNVESHQEAIVTLETGSITTASLVTCYWPGNLNQYRLNSAQPKFDAVTVDVSPIYESTVSFVGINEWDFYNKVEGRWFTGSAIVTSPTNDYLNNPHPTGFVQFTNKEGQLISVVSPPIYGLPESTQASLQNGYVGALIRPERLTTTGTNYFSTTTLTATYLGDSIRSTSSSTRVINFLPEYARYVSLINATTYQTTMDLNINSYARFLPPNQSMIRYLDIISTATFNFGFLPGTTGIEGLDGNSFKFTVRQLPWATGVTNTPQYPLTEFRINDVAWARPYLGTSRQIIPTSFDAEKKVWSINFKSVFFNSGYFNGTFNQPMIFTLELNPGYSLTLPDNIVLWRSDETQGIMPPPMSGFNRERPSSLFWQV